MIHIWLFIKQFKASNLGINPKRGGIPAIDKMAIDVGRIANKGNFFICLILLIDSLCKSGNKIKVRIP